MDILDKVIQSQASSFHNIVDFDSARDQIVSLNFTESNKLLTKKMLMDTALFSCWIDEQIEKSGAKYAIGGYNENRTIYSRSTHFSANDEPRRLHLGVDIWASAGTPVYNFHDAKVHSFAYNDNFGDYGATIILSYKIEGFNFYVLYGHLNLASLKNIAEGDFVAAGEIFANFGATEENGHWPPHLHLQIIRDMQGMKGDYPGVCKFSERKMYLANCPDPHLILRHNFKIGL